MTTANKPKANSVITRVVDDAAGTITFTVTGEGSVVLDLAKVHAANQRAAMFHGFGQRIQDNAALSRDTTTGKPASPAEKFAAIAELVDFYNTGSPDWSPARSGGGGADSLLVSALLRMKPEADPAALREKVRALTKAQRDALLVSDEVRPYADAIRAERAKSVDTGALLASII